MALIARVEQLAAQGLIPQALQALLLDFYRNYREAIEENGHSFSQSEPLLHALLDHLIEQLTSPYRFPPYHERVVKPFDFYNFGLDFLRPLVKESLCSIQGRTYVEEIARWTEAGENVVLFANHQTEVDPQAISLLLEPSHPQLAREMIFVAGHRVTTDPIAVPFSKGRNLLCIYSKNYLEHPPEQKREKVHHNQRTMKKMRELLSEGGRCIYVAPSGGRDRKNAAGLIEVACFDPQSIEMFCFIAQHSTRPTHFYPLALSTFDLLPPPPKVELRLGEQRLMRSSPIHLAFGPKIDIKAFADAEGHQKKELRTDRADVIWKIVKALYASIDARG